MSLLDTASLVVTPNGTKASKLYSVVPSSGAGDLDVTRATTATRVNSSGLIESVASNVPRLDYTNGSCPSILVEPQRTNISKFVEAGTGGFDAGTVTSGTSILGLTTFKVTTNVTFFGDAPYIDSNTQFQANTAYTFSFYTDFSKTNDTDISCSFLAFFPTLGYAGIRINKATKAITTFNVGGIWTLNNYEAIQISGDIYKIVATATPNATGLGASRNYISTNNDLKYAEFAGVQLEAGSYATSFINKASSASVTRNADVISKTGISSLIGQTEGTIFFDVLPNNTLSVNVPIRLDDTTSSNRIQFEWSGVSTANLLIASGGSWSVLATGLSVPQNIHSKIAIAYKVNDFVLYVNGTQIVSDTSGAVPASLTDVKFYETSSFVFSGGINSAVLWKTRLTNTQLAQLTTI